MSPASPSRESNGSAADLPLLSTTPSGWAELTAARLPVFLADHAVCEQQAALTALTLIGQYPGDDELVERMSALAIEEITHLRRVTAILHARGLSPAGRRSNAWVKALRGHIEARGEPALKVDRLLAFAMIEARSCERFRRLLEVIDDADVIELLNDLGPAEERHWRMFRRLAGRDLPAGALETRWQRWLEIERDLTATGGKEPTVHG